MIATEFVDYLLTRPLVREALSSIDDVHRLVEHVVSNGDKDKRRFELYKVARLRHKRLRRIVKFYVDNM